MKAGVPIKDCPWSTARTDANTCKCNCACVGFAAIREKRPGEIFVGRETREFHGNGFLFELLSINRSDRPFQGADEQLLLDGGARCVRDLSRYGASGNQKDAKAPRQILKNRDQDRRPPIAMKVFQSLTRVESISRPFCNCRLALISAAPRDNNAPNVGS